MSAEADEQAPLLFGREAGVNYNTVSKKTKNFGTLPIVDDALFQTRILDDETTGILERRGSDASNAQLPSSTNTPSSTVLIGYIFIGVAQISFPFTQLFAKMLQTRAPYLSATGSMFLRYVVTIIICLAYTPFIDRSSLKTFLFAPKEVRKLLTLRSIMSYLAGYSLTYSVR